MSGLQRRSALAHRIPLSTGDGAAALREIAFEGKLILRGALDAIGGAAAGVLGVGLPGKVLETTARSRGTAQWLGPDEWLIVCAPGQETSLAHDFEQALSGKHAQVVDVTDYYTTIELSGAHARAMLMKIATVDFHPRAFTTGMAVTTNVGRAVAWLRQTPGDAFAIVIRISMADYVWCLLAEAGREFGLPEVAPKGRVPLHPPQFETAPGEPKP